MRQALLLSLVLAAAACAPRGAASTNGPHPCARVSPDGRHRCLSAHGAVLFAIGNEPGWTLVLLPDAFALELEYGERQLRGVIHERGDGARATRFFGSSDETRVTIEVREHRCEDVMSGAPYPAEVVVTLPGAVARGCGFFVRD
jgi:uncharacterized membrane protein